MSNYMPTEVYRLTLTHYMLLDDGVKLKLDDPIIIQNVACHGFGNVGTLLNRMFDEMKTYALNTMDKENEQ